MEREKRYATEGFHLGNLIKIELMRQGRSITWLASQVDCSRENLYKVFRHKWIYTDLLFQICDALDYDFFKVCSAQICMDLGRFFSKFGKIRTFAALFQNL